MAENPVEQNCACGKSATNFVTDILAKRVREVGMTGFIGNVGQGGRYKYPVENSKKRPEGAVAPPPLTPQK